MTCAMWFCTSGCLLGLLLVTSTSSARSGARLYYYIEEAERSPIIGIDFGNSNLYVSVATKSNDPIVFIPDDQGNLATPSYIAWDGDKLLIGAEAKAQAIINPLATIYDMNRLIGRTFDEVIVQADIKRWPFQVIDKGGKPVFKVPVGGGADQMFTPEEVTAMLLSYLRQNAEKYLGTNVALAVLAAPSDYTDAQRQALKEAGARAGLRVLRVMRECHSAGRALSMDMMARQDDIPYNVAVVHLGGRALRVTAMYADYGVYDLLASGGDSHLGGEDFTDRIVAYYTGIIDKKYGKNISENRSAMQRLRNELERAKCALSHQSQVHVHIDSLTDGVNVSEVLTRSQFEELNMDLFHKAMSTVINVLAAENCKPADVDYVLLIGGSTQIPMIRQMIRAVFDGKHLSHGIEPELAVAYGLGIEGAILCGDSGYGDLHLIPTCDIFLSLGVQVSGGVMHTHIQRGAKCPKQVSNIYTTHEDDQTTVHIRVFEGERLSAQDNILLGEMQLTGLPPAPKGVLQIEVTVRMDDYGDLHASAEEHSSGIRANFSVSRKFLHHSMRLIERLGRGAEAAEEADEMIRQGQCPFDDADHMTSNTLGEDVLDADLTGVVLSQAAHPPLMDEHLMRQRCDTSVSLYYLGLNA